MYIHLTTEYTLVKFSFSNVSKFPVINLEVTQEKTKFPGLEMPQKIIIICYKSQLTKCFLTLKSIRPHRKLYQFLFHYLYS